MGVDVASFGDFFAEQRSSRPSSPPTSAPAQSLHIKKPAPATSEPLSHNQQDPNKPKDGKPKVWEVVGSSTSPAPENSAAITIEHKESAVANSADGSGLGSEADKKEAARKKHGAAAAADGPIETLTYRDPFAGVYKK